MKYKRLLKLISAENNTTPQEVDKEIRKAIQAAGYDIEPELFISILIAKAESQIKKGNKKPPFS